MLVKAKKEPEKDNAEKTSTVSEERQSTNQSETESTENVGFFRRIINFFKRLFSRKKNTQTSDGRDAAQLAAEGNASAESSTESVSDSDIAQTLSPDITDTGVTEDIPVKNSNITLDIQTGENGAQTAISGSVMIFGQSHKWQSEEPIVVNKDGDVVTAQGVIKIADDALKVNNLKFDMDGDSVKFSGEKNTTAEYTVDGITMLFPLSGEYKNLAEVTPASLEISGRKAEGVPDGVFENPQISIGKSITVNNVSKDIGEQAPNTVNKFIKSLSNKNKLMLRNGDKGLQYGVYTPDAVIQKDGGKFYHISSIVPQESFTEILNNDNIRFTLPKTTITLYLLNNRIKKSFTLDQGITITSGDGLSAIDLKLENMQFGEKYNLNSAELSLDFEKGIYIRNGNIEGTDDNGKISISDFNFSIDENGIVSESAAVSMTNENLTQPLVASIKNLRINTDSWIAFDSAKINIKNLTVAESYHMENCTAELSVIDGDIGFDLHSNMNFDLSRGLLKVSSQDLSVDLSYNRKASDNTGNKFNLGSLVGSISGEVKAGLYIVNDKPLAEADIKNIAFDNDGLCIQELGVQTGDVDVSGFKVKAAMNVKGLRLKDKSINFDSLSIHLDKIAYQDNVVAENLEQPENQDDGESEIKLGSTASPIKLSNMETTAEDARLYLKMSSDEFKLGVAVQNFHIATSQLYLDGGVEKSYFGESLNMSKVKLGSQELDTAAKTFLGIDAIEFSATEVSISNDNVNFKEIAANIQKEITLLGNLKLTEFGVKVTADNIRNIKDIEFTGKFNYSHKHLSVGADLISGYDFEKSEFGIRNIENIELSVGHYGKAAIGSVVTNPEGFDLMNMIFASNSFDEEGLGKRWGIVGTFLKEVPSVTVHLEKLSNKNGKFIMPRSKDFKIDKIEQDFSFLDNAFNGKFTYDDGTIDVTLNAGYSLPKDRKENKSATKVLLNPTATIPIVAPFLSAEAGFQIFAGASINGSMGFQTKKNDKQRDISIGTNLVADGTIGAGVTFGVSAFQGLLNAQIEGNALANGVGSISGATAITYEKKDTLAQSLSVDKTKTSLNYDIKGNLVLSFDVSAGAKIPAIFLMESKELKHKWNIAQYELGTVDLTGNLNWNDEKQGFDFESTNDIKLNTGKKLDIEAENKKLDVLNQDYTKCRQILEEVDAAVASIDDSTEIIGLGGTLTLIKSKQILDIRNKLSDIIEIGNKRATQIYEEIIKKRKLLEDMGIRKVKNDQRQKYIDKVSEDSQKALDIINVEEENDNYSDYYQKIMKNLSDIQNNADKKNELAALDPMALLHILRAFQLPGSKDIAKETISRDQQEVSVDKYARELSMHMYSNNEFVIKQLLDRKLADKKEEEYKAMSRFTLKDKTTVDALKSINKKSAIYKDANAMDSEILGLYEELYRLQGEPNDNTKAIQKLMKKIEDKKSKYSKKIDKKEIANKSSILQAYIKRENIVISNNAETKENFVKAVAEGGSLQAIENSDEFSLRLEFVEELLKKIYNSNESFMGTTEGALFRNRSHSQKKMKKNISNMNSKKAITASIKQSTLKDVKLDTDEKIQMNNKDFDDVSGLFDDYIKVIQDFNTNTISAMAIIDRIFNEDYESVKTQQEYKEKSQNIKELLNYVEPSDIGSIKKDLDSIEI